MDDAVAQAIVAGGLDPATCEPSTIGGAVWRIEIPAGQNSFATWVAIAKVAKQTKVWPILRGDSGDIQEEPTREPAEVIAAAPIGTAREVLRPRIEALREQLREWEPSIANATDLDRMAVLADASGVNAFSGRRTAAEAWPTEPPEYTTVRLNTLKGRRSKPTTLLLVQIDHTYEVPAHLGFGGWNECPEPALQVAVLREWQQQYNAVPPVITGDVMEMVVTKRPQTEADSMRLAAEQWVFCEEIVSGGTQTIRQLAIQLWRAPTWFFWWD